MIELMDEYGAGGLCAVITEAASAALGRAGAESAGVEVLLVDDGEIRRLNREQRGVDAATDVLSFPMLKFDRPLVSKGVDVSRMNAPFLGSVVISVDRLMAQAEQYGHPAGREAAFLATHGVLHLLGYDHEDADGERAMREAQESVLAAAGWTRG